MSDSPFSVDLEAFKRLAVKFMKRCADETVTLEALEGAKSAFALHYLNFRGTDLDVRQAAIVFEIGMARYLDRTLGPARAA
jgi:hypothetical protein